MVRKEIDVSGLVNKHFKQLIWTGDNVPDMVEQLYIESPAMSLAEFRNRIELLTEMARLKELQMVEINGVGPVFVWTTGEDPDMAMLIPERRAELEESIKAKL